MRTALAAGLAALAFAAPASAATATLRVVTVSPFTVRGAGFAARASVWVAVTSGRQHAERHVRASAAGAFVVTFTAMKVSGCRGYVVRAIDSARNAAIARSPSVRCPPRP
jgi:hypothetical protein